MRVPASLATDVRSLDALREGAARDPKAAVQQAASQFEALFMQMVLKSMRDAVPRTGMFDGAGRDVYEGMLDTQFSQAMSGRPGGLTDMIARQLSRHMRAPDGEAGPGAPSVSAEGLRRALAGTQGATQAGRGAVEAVGGTQDPARQAVVRARPAGPAQSAIAPQSAAAAQPAASAQPAVAAQPAVPDDVSPAAFVRRMWEPAIGAQQATGVPAEFIVGQAALESGWGRRELRHADGTPAYNLFGIKAGPGWRGATVESVTTEYVDGNPIRTVERFRAYGSHQESFADWARLMAENPRYAGVLRGGGSIGTFAQGLQRAGYATDPNYAAKLSRTIGQALALSRDAA